MKILQIAELRSKFSALLKEVSMGHEIGISYGRKKETIAVIIPIDEYKKMKARRLGTLQGKATVEFKGEWKLSDEELLNS